jgi:hypothetical protein
MEAVCLTESLTRFHESFDLTLSGAEFGVIKSHDARKYDIVSISKMFILHFVSGTDKMATFWNTANRIQTNFK